ncbi:MAG: hypothetical protein K2Y22_14020 [Candidatus Obscuribacterales bacterium]|nr:hypothetical protein [Candidatus Obscuribacterales bacterium]
MHDIPSTALGVALLALIVFGRSYKHHLELFRGDWLLGTFRLWPLVGLLLAAGSQYFLCQGISDQSLIAAIDGIALYAAYLQICRNY